MKLKSVRWVVLFGAVIVVFLAAWDLSQPQVSPLPDGSEKLSLASQHARCAGAYTVFMQALKTENPNFAELNKRFSSDLERHVSFALLLYENQANAELQIKEAVTKFAGEVKADMERNNPLSVIINATETECINADVKTAAFLNQAILPNFVLQRDASPQSGSRP